MYTSRFIEVMKTAELLVNKSLAVKKGEQVLIVADTESDFLVVNGIAAAVHSVGAEPTITIMPLRERGGCTPLVDEAIKIADVVITAATKSVGHRRSVHKALLEDKTMRMCALIGIDYDSFTRGGATMDVDELYRITERVAKVMNQGKKIRVTCDLGTDLTGVIEGMPCKAAGGYARNPGELATFPDGEAWQAPRDGTTEGTLVIDTSIAYLGLISEPIKFTIRQGRVVNIEGGKDATRLKNFIQGVENIDNIAEIAVGTNPKARITGNIMEDKHGAGRVHVAIGDNRLYGGKTACQLHMDMVMSKPTVRIDEKTIIENGRIII